MKSSLSKSFKCLLVGPPNSGKTTLFNWLTGYKARVVNYPGSTVDYSKGSFLKKYKTTYLSSIIDTPGVYSLLTKNPSEKITENLLFQEEESSLIIAVVDALRIRRQLPLVLQLKEAGFHVVVALTMVDLIPDSIDIQKLSKELDVSVCPIEGKLGKGVGELVQELEKQTSLLKKQTKRSPGAWLSQKQDSFFNKTDKIIDKVFSKKIENNHSQTLDRFLLHPLWGVVSFIGIMTLLFSSIFWLAAPLMDLVDVGFSVLAEKVLSLGDSLWVDFLSKGVITSFAAVFVFVPQIFILFAGICILEDTGYLARSASLTDAVFSKFGLSGRAFIPFLSGYACAIPACLSARNITSRMERLIVIAVIPLLTCSARLPVYSLLLSLLFFGEPAWKPGIWMTLIYIGSMVLAAIAAGVLSRFVPKEERPPFVMELPLYRRPLFFGVLSLAWRRTSQYIKGAGPLIFIFALGIWAATHFPRDISLSESRQIQQSYAGKFGQKIEPAFEVMGGDWRVGVSLISAFVAREVFVSTLATLFQITQEASEETLQHSLLRKMSQAQNKRGDPLFTPLSLVALILFFMISLQCLSTTAIVKKETGSTLFAVTQLVALNLMAYFLCVLVYQVGQSFYF